MSRSGKRAVPVVLSTAGVLIANSPQGENVPIPRLLVVLFHQRFDAPPKVLALLNCTSPGEPPGVLPDPPQAEPVEDTTPSALICKQFVDVLPRPEMTRLVVDAPALKVWSWLQLLAVVVPHASEMVLAVLRSGYENV